MVTTGVSIDEKILAKRLPEDADVHALLTQLQREYETRGVNLVRVAGKWALRQRWLPRRRLRAA